MLRLSNDQVDVIVGLLATRVAEQDKAIAAMGYDLAAAQNTSLMSRKLMDDDYYQSPVGINMVVEKDKRELRNFEKEFTAPRNLGDGPMGHDANGSPVP